MQQDPPLIGITVDNRDSTAASGKYECAAAYAQAVADAGGLPMLLPQFPERAGEYVHSCHGLILTGGDDPLMEQFGGVTHPKAKRMDRRRQAFELALLDAAAEDDLPVLGICLGMQLMGLHAGAGFDQYLPDTLGPAADIHRDSHEHSLVFEVDDSIVPRGEGVVVSWHTQALTSPGCMRLVARAADGVVEAIDDPSRRFYLGVQWHPERIAPERSPALNRRLFDQLVEAARCPR